MKFTDGYWRLREGMQVLRPLSIDEVIAGDRTLTVYAPTTKVVERGDTLNRPLVTVTFFSPMSGVIGVTIEHFRGVLPPKPVFEVRDEAPEVVTAVGESEATFSSGPLTARISTVGTWNVTFEADGRMLTSSGARSIGAVTDAAGRHFVHEQLNLGVGENLYGLGERFGAFVKNGQTVETWNEDGGTTSDIAYKNVPFYLSNLGYGVFVDHPERVSFEIGTEVVSRAQFSVEGQSLTYYVIHGPTPKDVLRTYTAMTGRPARVPAWSYGLWLSTSFTTSYDEATVTSFVDGMAERNLPLSVFHFDCFWMRQFHWCDFIWDPATFPDPEGMLRRLRDRGLKICVWINPYIAQRSYLFDEGARLGYLVKRADGSVWQWDNWQAGMGLVDFTNPEAAQWFASKLKALMDIGVDAFKTDFGERIPTDVVWADGSDPQKMHNYYTHLYNRCVFELLERERGEGEAVLFARSATAGGQMYPVHWGGDCESTFESMAESLRGGLSLSLSGFGYWSHDIGGFEGEPDAAVFKRWLAFGLLSSHSRLHGSTSYRVPWAFDEEAVEVTRQFTELKMSLMPYLAGVAEDAHAEGLPIMRPMLLEFPDDPTAAYCDRQYMLGENLLVAPVFTESGEVTFYVPDGVWTHLVTGEELRGPRWVTQKHGFDSLPLLVRPGSVIPVGAVTSRPDYAWADGVTLRPFGLQPGSVTSVRIPSPDGGEATVFDVACTDDGVHAELVSGASASWSVG